MDGNGKALFQPKARVRRVTFLSAWCAAGPMHCPTPLPGDTTLGVTVRTPLYLRRLRTETLRDFVQGHPPNGC
jgi:hypothetical protein